MIVLPKGTEKKLLLHLLLNGPTIASRITEIRNAARTARQLEDKKLISRTADKYDFSPQPAMLLSLTVDGIAVALQLFLIKNGAVRLIDRKILDSLFNIASIWIELLPTVFGKWDLFRKENVEHIAAIRLVYASYSVADRMESMGQAGVLWNPVKRDITSEEHIENVFTRFFYDLIYDPTFNRIAYLAKWMSSLRKPNLDTRDAPLLTWIHALRNDAETKNYISDNLRRAKAEIKRFEILTYLFEDDTSKLTEMEKSLLYIMKEFY